jgi:hypothetical protein
MKRRKNERVEWRRVEADSQAGKEVFDRREFSNPRVSPLGETTVSAFR